MKSAFYFTLKALLFLRYFNFCCDFFDYARKRLGKKAEVNTPPWVFFTFLKLYKWYQIAQRITYFPIFQ